MQILIAMSHWAGSSFFKHHKYWNMAETHLRYAVVAQSQGDHAAGQCIWGQDLFELQDAADTLPSASTVPPTPWAQLLCLSTSSRATTLYSQEVFFVQRL